jgi:hypothetical protein
MAECRGREGDCVADVGCFRAITSCRELDTDSVSCSQSAKCKYCENTPGLSGGCRSISENCVGRPPTTSCTVQSCPVGKNTGLTASNICNSPNANVCPKDGIDYYNNANCVGTPISKEKSIHSVNDACNYIDRPLDITFQLKLKDGSIAYEPGTKFRMSVVNDFSKQVMGYKDINPEDFFKNSINQLQTTVTVRMQPVYDSKYYGSLCYVKKGSEYGYFGPAGYMGYKDIICLTTPKVATIDWSGDREKLLITGNNY